MSRIEQLIRDMTLSEKLGQMTMTASGYAVTGPIIVGDSTDSIRDGSVGNLLNIVGPGPTREVQKIAVEESRLGIPLLIGLDIIHGHRTLFPLPIAEAATFDPELWELTASEAAAEGAADGLAMTFAPMLDVSRDLRWGRTAEGSGEDAFVASRMAQAKVKGFQGSDLAAADRIAACAKHFCAYGPVNAGREYASVDISERTLREVHLPPFVAAVNAGVATIMPAFTDLNGIPMSAHKGLLRDYLRGELGFDGVLVSDYNAIGELIRHGVAADLVEAAVLALNAGIDIDMMADAYRKGLPVALERGLVTMDQIDASVRRVLKLKEQLGLFDDPYRRSSRVETAEALLHRRQIARRVAAKSIVMLKNDGETLPLPRTTRRIAVLGPLADAASEMCGCWWAAGENEPNVSVLAGLRDAMPDVELRYASGTSIQGDDQDGVDAALTLIDGSEAVMLCVGEAMRMSGEAASRAYPGLPGRQSEFAQAVLERAAQAGIPVVSIVFSGRPLVIPELASRSHALLAAWFLGTEAGNAIADVVTGAVSPSGRTPMSWPRALGQVPIFYGQRPSGRPFSEGDFFTSKYLDVGNEPLYPFGHGLSYGRFELSDLQVTPALATHNDRIQIRVTVTNHGTHAGEQTLFVFSRDPVASVVRPVLELRGFGKIELNAGEQRVFEHDFEARDLAFLGVDLNPVFETGDIEIRVGPSADQRLQLMQKIQIVKS